MQFRNLALAALASAAYGQDLKTALSNQPSLSNLTTYLNLFPSLLSQISQMSNITLLAPNNNAFEMALNASGGAFQNNDTSLIEAVLSYHVLNGSYSNFSSMPMFIPTALGPGMYANHQWLDNDLLWLFANSTVTNSTNFTNGYIHIIDRFLTLPANITDTAVQLGLRSAVGALQVAGLASAVDMLENVTCFIPQNEAFQAIGGTLATDSQMDLSRILEYHVVNGSVLYSTDIKNGTKVVSMNDLELTISTYMDKNGTEVIYVNSAKVVTPNVLVGNGVVHVIDNVLNPGNRTAVPNYTATSDSPAFSGASSATGEVFTSGVASATTTVETGAVASATASGSSSSSSSGLAAPMATGGLGAAALFGGAAVLMNM
ncbi:Stabilin-2 [Cyphellophora attinorum]|uniref:Stabilin-2 n=1 Tax=Cyphellophora attinorum TaxID=1664694 RepID=A0A0N0NIJ1_9EURO|nr:Stabilin-2 [Phialophora attinorum]KPI35499.1 Stabilin-2 [Phialophora attinorum]